MLGSYGLALWAMTRAPIALVAALRETSVIFALVIAAHITSRAHYPDAVRLHLHSRAGALAIKVS